MPADSHVLVAKVDWRRAARSVTAKLVRQLEGETPGGAHPTSLPFSPLPLCDEHSLHALAGLCLLGEEMTLLAEHGITGSTSLPVMPAPQQPRQGDSISRLLADALSGSVGGTLRLGEALPQREPSLRAMLCSGGSPSTTQS